MAYSKKIKFILSLISSLSFCLCTEVLLATAGLNVYIMSYIHEKQSWVKMSYSNYIYPVVWSAQSFFIIFSGDAEKIFRPKGTMIVGTVIMQISLVGLFFQQNIFLLFPLLIIYSVGAGISLNMASKNALFYYPKYVGLISSLELVVSALSAGFFALLGEYIINPSKSLVNSAGFYDLEISQRSKYYFLFAFTSLTVGNYLAVLLYQQYIPAEDAEPEEKEQNKLKEPLNKKSEINLSNEESAEKHSISMSATAALKENKNEIKKIFSTIRIYRNLYLNSGSGFWLYFLTSTFRNYISQVNFDGTIQKYLFALSDVPQIISSPLWGIYADKHTFKSGMMIINVSSALICLFIVLTIQYQYCFAFSVLAMTTVFSAAFIIIPTHMLGIYGIKNMLFLEGLMTFSEGIFHIFGAVLSVILEKISGGGENLTPVYRITFIALFVLSLTGFPVACFEGEEEFDFSDVPKLIKKDDRPSIATQKINKNINSIKGGLEPENDEVDEEENEEEEKNEENVEEILDVEKKGEIKGKENKE